MARGSRARDGRVARSEVTPSRKHNGLPASKVDAEEFDLDYQLLKGMNPDGVKAASEGKEATGMAQAKMRLIVAIGERMEALAKDPNWKGNNEMNDPTSPFNLKNLKEALTNQSREFSYQFDANGDLVSWSKGTKGRVQSYYLKGMLKGGVDVHNHPSEKDRPFGWTFSGQDFISYNNSGVAVGIVHSREGEYRLDFPDSFSQRSRAEVERMASDFDYRFNAIQSGAQMLLNKAISEGGRDGNPIVSLAVLLESVSRVAGQLMLAETQKVAKQIGAKFTFTPNKGYEGWKPLSFSDDNETRERNFKEIVANPSPEHKIVSGLRKPPHLTTFKAPPAVTARGYTIGEPRDVKAPRKPRTPKPKEEPQESSNNNYFRL